jgi:hypothetical protein
MIQMSVKPNTSRHPECLQILHRYTYELSNKIGRQFYEFYQTPEFQGIQFHLLKVFI